MENKNQSFTEKITESIPDEIKNQVEHLKIKEVGFGAGPSFVARHTNRFDSPVDLKTALAYLDKYKEIFKMARMELTNGYTILIDRNSFMDYKQV